MDQEGKLLSQRLEKLSAIKAMHLNPYPHSYPNKEPIQTLLQKHSTLNTEQKTTEKARVAGRILTLRRMGKASFYHIQDSTGKIQIYIKEDEVGHQTYTLFENLDLGDIIGVEGYVFKTKTGELTVRTEKLTLLSKSLRPLPEKWHGLNDV